MMVTLKCPFSTINLSIIILVAVLIIPSLSAVKLENDDKIKVASAYFKKRNNDFDNGGLPYFGLEFNPLINGGPSKPDIKKMLRITQAKSGSIFTNDMGYSNQDYTGPWDVSTNSGIATSCAEMNRDSRSQVCAVLQGAIISPDAGPGSKPLDLDAAFISAKHANGIYPNSVWGIREGVGWEKGGGYVKDTRTGYKVVQEMRNYFTKAHGFNLKIGVFVGICGEILGGDGKKMLGDLAVVSDFFVCGVYPLMDIQDPQDYVNYVTNKFEDYRSAYSRIAPKLELILQTGWSGGDVQKGNQFWSGMQRWADEKGVKVYLHEAFDSVTPRGGLGNAGYWKMDKNGDFVVKGSGKIVD